MRALILGGAACVWDDLAAAEALADFDLLLAVNDAGAEYPGVIDYWITLHPEHFPRWAGQRAENGHLPARVYVAHERNTLCGRPSTFPLTLWPYTWAGSSGLFAAEVALKMLAAEHVVLCGVPMTATPHFFDAEPWRSPGDFWPAWPAAYPQIKDKVRSMSGRTKELLGEPSSEWLHGAD